jgi:hypothetical protein
VVIRREPWSADCVAGFAAECGVHGARRGGDIDRGAIKATPDAVPAGETTLVVVAGDGFSDCSSN